jgi:predicted lipoprotein with Yx(FWY)xxD motif
MRSRLAIGVLAVAAVLGAGCGSSSKTSNAATESQGTTTTVAKSAGADPNATGGSTTTTVASGTSSAASVKVTTDAKLGQILVGPDGRTLYLFEKDQGTTSACTGGCAATWPALTVSGSPTAGAGVTAGLLTAAGGQVVYNGHLLYYFAGDKAAGDVNGKGIASWYPVSPAGAKVG